MQDPGNTFKTSTKVRVPFIPPPRKPTIIVNSVSANDKVDTYQFNFKNRAAFNLSLTKLQSNVDVKLFNRKGKLQGISQNPGKDSEFINTSLKKGIYYIQVKRKGGKTRYRMTLGSEEAEISSLGTIQLTGVSENTFNPVGNNASFQISNASFSTDPLDVKVLLNGQEVPDASLSLLPNSISLPSLLVEGRNNLELYAADTQGRELHSQATIWAGSQTLTATVFDKLGQPVSNATVNAKLGDDQDVQATASTNAQGQVVFSGLPDRTISLEALASGNQYGFFATTGGAGSVGLTVAGFDSPSLISNNDFSLGTDGWNIGTAPVQIIPHIEGSSNQLTSGTQSIHTNSSNRNGKSKKSNSLKKKFNKQIKSAATGSEPDQDLVLNTSGEGVQSVGRSFSVEPGAKSITIRYKFITSEIPGGYFGSKFNDYFKITARSEKGGGFESAGNSMNGLGLTAFTADGATAWRELTLPIAQAGDTIQVDVAVANVSDGLFDSQIVVDKIDTKKLDITKLDLNDIDNTDLSFLSLAPHTYFGGNTRVNGTISIAGSKQDSLQALSLEVLLGNSVIATGNLAASLRKSLLNQKFGDDEKIEINASQLLFDIPSSQGVSTLSDVSLRVKATSASGEVATKDFGSVPVLTRYTGTNRYGIGRDESVGGDDWVKPNVLPIISHFSGIQINDISNMNGGKFPPHGTHQDGTHIDGWFNGYNARNAAVAATMIGYLNDPTYGSNIRTVYVTFSRTATNPFWNAIKDVTLNDGRLARDVIVPIAGHDTHFHWVIAP